MEGTETPTKKLIIDVTTALRTTIGFAHCNKKRKVTRIPLIELL